MPANIHSPPPEVIASWPTPNHVNPDRITFMPGIVGSLSGISTILVVTRLCLRAKGQAGLGLDDLFLAAGWISAVAYTTVILLATERYENDRHIWDIRATVMQPLFLCAWLAQLFYLSSTGFTKLAVLCFCRRLVKGTHRPFWKYATIAAIGFTVLYTIAFIMTLTFGCRPVSAYWRSADPSYTREFRCLDMRFMNPLSGAVSVFSDAYAVLLPCLMMRGLQAPRRQKIALNFVFSLGLLVVGAGIVRTYYLDRLNHTWDTSWIGYRVHVWAELEVQLGLICASAPALRVLCRQYLAGPVTRVWGTVRSRNLGSPLGKRDSSILTALTGDKNGTMVRETCGDEGELCDDFEMVPTDSHSRYDSMSPHALPSTTATTKGRHVAGRSRDDKQSVMMVVPEETADLDDNTVRPPLRNDRRGDRLANQYRWLTPPPAALLNHPRPTFYDP